MELKAIQLTKQYGSKTAVNHLNLSLSNGVYGLLGANGAGKTTLMRLLCDIQTPTSGKITLDGKNISVLGEKYRNLLGYLPQQFGYYPDFTAWDFLMYVAALKGLSEKQAHKKATELLEAVDLAEKRNLKIKTFSGGMKQRLGIAQAMLNNPRILILDEPTAGLDPKERVRFRNLISAFSKDRKAALVQALYGMAGSPGVNTENISFADLDSSNPAFKAAVWAVSNGIVKASDGKFEPDSEISVADFGLAMIRFSAKVDFNLKRVVKTVSMSFNLALENKFMIIKRSITRAQAAQKLAGYRYY